MRMLIALLFMTQVQAQDLARPVPKPAPPQAWPADVPRAVVAVNRSGIVLLRETCGWPGGAMRAYHVSQGRVTWACWGYTEAGIVFQWATGQHTTQPFGAFRTERGTLTYPGLYTHLNPVK
jgi:hypothetical protein